MKCPYQDIDCPFVDTSDMTKIDCYECENYEGSNDSIGSRKRKDVRKDRCEPKATGR
jgi:hypothetical protein